jgi:hypothetical protein
MDFVKSLVKYVRTQWDRVGAWVSIAAGAIALLVGWLGVSGTTYPSEQIPYVISGGLVGLFLLGLGAMLWLSADLHDEWRKLDAIERAQRAGSSLAVEEARPLEHAEDREDRAAAGPVAQENENGRPKSAARLR